MVRAISVIRSTRATYSSRTPGLRRERNTVTIIAGMLLPFSSAQVSRADLLIVLVNAAEFSNPRPRRAEPDLPPRHQLIALFQNPDAHHVRDLRTIAGPGRIDRRSAFWAKRLGARIAACRGGLQVDRGLPVHFEIVAGDRNRYPKGAAGSGLAIGAVADHDAFRIDLGRDGDRAAMAGAFHPHDVFPIGSSTELSMISISASDRPKWWPISCTSTCRMIAPSVSSCSAQ